MNESGSLRGMRHPDDCPNCGERVEALTSYGIGSGTPPDATQQATTCPNCQTKLRRNVGEPWREATGPGADVS